jgi:hypothetical protein
MIKFNTQLEVTLKLIFFIPYTFNLKKSQTNTKENQFMLLKRKRRYTKVSSL